MLKAWLPGVTSEDLSIDATSEIIVIKGQYKVDVLTLPKSDVVKPTQIKVKTV